MKHSFRRYLGVLATVLASLSTSTWVMAATIIGEDGQPYNVDVVEQKRGLDKIAPSLRLAGNDEKLDVLIYLARPEKRAGDADPVETVKKHHLDIIDAIGEQIRGIRRADWPSESLNEEQEKAYVRSIANKPMAAAKQAQLDSLKRELDAARTDMHKAVSAAIVAAGRSERASMRTVIEGAGGTVHSEVALVNALGATIRADMLQSLAFDDRVIEILPNLPADYELEVSTQSVGFQTYHNNGIDGSGIFDIGVIDTGVQENHPNLAPAEGFFTNAASPVDSDLEVGHGTHVTGIVASNHSTIQGGVPNVGAIIWEYAGLQGTTMSRMHNLASDFVQSPEAVNHSLGYGIANDVDYNSNDSFYDAYVQNFSIMVTKSAGNRGWTTTDPGDSTITITHPATAYNLLSVANMNDRGTTSRLDDYRSSSSSVGPTVNGRRKPDISAPGTNINSTNFFWPGSGELPYNGCNGPNEPGTDNIDNFCILSGTSMAAPHVAGGILLMEDAGNITPRGQKAVMLNTADAWTSNNTSTVGDDGPVSPSCAGSNCDTLWDKSYGWGYMDLTEAHFNNNDYFHGSVVARNDNATEDDYKLYKGFMFNSEKATMTWEKRADTYVDGGPATGQRALGDLNLRLYSNTTGARLDNDLTVGDNVHQVVSPQSGEAVIKVYSWSTSFSGTTSMPFTLATEENFQAVNPPSFDATPLIPIVGPFQTFTVGTSVTNNGTTGAHQTNVALGNIPGVTGDNTSQNVGTILDGESETAEFELTTNGLGAGTYLAAVTVSSFSYDETYTDTISDGVQFIVETSAPTSDCTLSDTYTNDTQINIPWSASDGFFGTGVDFAQLYVRKPGSFVYQYTGLQQSGASGTFNYPSNSGDGLYYFAVRARDRGGNWETFPFSADCNVFRDTIRPTSNVSTPQIVAGGTIPLTFSASDATPSSGIAFVDFWYYKEPAGPWTYTGEFTNANNGVINWLPPEPGVYHFFSRVKDNAQNIEFDLFPAALGDSSTNYGGIDTDGDGVLDLADNCTELPNPAQRDTNGDGYGNMCDPDLNNDGVVNFVDIQIWTQVFNQACGDVDEDLNGDGVCNFIDYQMFPAFFLQPPGPSGLAP